MIAKAKFHFHLDLKLCCHVLRTQDNYGTGHTWVGLSLISGERVAACWNMSIICVHTACSRGRAG
jgi:hypothetical protein